MDLQALFPPSEAARIDEATRRAESKSRGEIVTVAVPASGSYDGAPWRGAAFGALGAEMILGLVEWLAGLWGPPLPLWPVLAAALGGAVGYALSASVPAIRRWLAPAEEIDRQVGLRARAAFLDHEVFRTRDRSGVLIFLSLLERRAVVLGDAGINARVAEGEWGRIVADLARGMGAGRPADALVGAIDACGDLLDRAGLERREDDRDELPNSIHLEGLDGEEGRS